MATVEASLGDLVTAAAKAVPENATARSIVPSAYAGAPTTINFDMNGRQPRTRVHVDPVGGREGAQVKLPVRLHDDRLDHLSPLDVFLFGQ